MSAVERSIVINERLGRQLLFLKISEGFGLAF